MSDGTSRECAPPASEGASIVCRLVGVPDGQPRALWTLWTGVGGQNCESRRQTLAAARVSPNGERAIAQVVTYSVLRALTEVTELASDEAIVRTFASASLEELTSWADDPQLLSTRLKAN